MAAIEGIYKGGRNYEILKYFFEKNLSQNDSEQEPIALIYI